jgi:hypothetical protein
MFCAPQGGKINRSDGASGHIVTKSGWQINILLSF